MDRYNDLVDKICQAFPSKLSRNETFLDLIESLCVTLKANNSQFSKEIFKEKIDSYFKSYK